MRLIKLIALLGFAVFPPMVFSAGVVPSNQMKVGNGAASDKKIIFDKGAGAANPILKWNNTNGTLQYSNDGTNFLDIGSGSGGGSGINVLVDPGFEGANGSWVASGGTYTYATSGAHLLFDKKSASWTPTGAQTLSQTVAMPNGLLSGNCAAQIRYKGGDSTHYTFKVTDGSNTLSNIVTLAASPNSVTLAPTVTFPCPSSGSIVWLLTASAAATQIDLDNVYMGSADISLGSFGQSQFIGSAYIATTGSCQPSRTSGTLGAFSTSAACPGPTVEFNPGPGVIQTTDTDLPQFTVNNLNPGEYEVTMQASVQSAAGTAPGLQLAINDGTTSSGATQSETVSTNGNAVQMTVIGHFSYSLGGNKTFALWGASTSSDITLINTLGSRNIKFRIVRFPTTQEQAYRPDLSNAAGSLKIPGVTNCQWGSTTGGSLGAFGADTDCVGAVVTGSASAPGTKIPGAVFSNVLPGKYMAIATGSFTSFYTTTNTSCGFALSDGTTTSGNFTINSYSGASTVIAPSITGYFTYASLQPSVPIQVVVDREGGGGTCYVTNSSAGIDQFEITLVPLDQAHPAPLLVNSMVSSYAGVGRHEWAKVETSCTSSPCTIVSQSGALTNITRASTGNYTLNFATPFSLAPTCNFTMYQCQAFARIQSASTTAYNVLTYTVGTTPALTDCAFDVTCDSAR